MAVQEMKLSPEQMMAIIAKQQAELEALKRKPAGRLSMKVSEKGAISVFGLQRFPVTLYASQWERILGMADEIRDFIKTNKAMLASKD